MQLDLQMEKKEVKNKLPSNADIADD